MRYQSFSDTPRETMHSIDRWKSAFDKLTLRYLNLDKISRMRWCDQNLTLTFVRYLSLSDTPWRNDKLTLPISKFRQDQQNVLTLSKIWPLLLCDIWVLIVFGEVTMKYFRKDFKSSCKLFFQPYIFRHLTEGHIFAGKFKWHSVGYLT